jgi:hypothetical protein
VPASKNTHHLFSQLFPCLSRACLGQMMFVSSLKCILRTGAIDQGRPKETTERKALRKTHHLFFSAFPMFVSSLSWSKNRFHM